MNLLDQRIEEYCIDKSTHPSHEALELEVYTRQNVHGSQMLIGRLEASFLGFLIRSISAKKILELGTFTGYSALAMSEHLPDSGEIITVDVNAKTVEIAKSFWNRSKNGNKIKSIIGPGLDVLSKFQTEKQMFDMIFIDADKRNYKSYLDLSLSLLNDNGIIVVDNVLWSGRVVPGFVQTLDKEDQEHRNTNYIIEMNDYVAANSNLYSTLLPIRDGIFLIRKK